MNALFPCSFVLFWSCSSCQCLVGWFPPGGGKRAGDGWAWFLLHPVYRQHPSLPHRCRVPEWRLPRWTQGQHLREGSTLVVTPSPLTPPSSLTHKHTPSSSSTALHLAGRCSQCSWGSPLMLLALMSLDNLTRDTRSSRQESLSQQLVKGAAKSFPMRPGFMQLLNARGFEEMSIVRGKPVI